MSYTPGPWHLEIAEDDSGRIKHFVPTDSENQSLLTVVDWDGVKFAAVYFDADARLIAAAPELLSLLKRYRDETPIGHQPHMIAHEADVLIDKIEGK